mgnify:CR=1
MLDKAIESGIMRNCGIILSNGNQLSGRKLFQKKRRIMLGGDRKNEF